MMVISTPFLPDPLFFPDGFLWDEPPDPPELLEPQAPRASVPVRTRASAAVRCMVLLWWFEGATEFIASGRGPATGVPPDVRSTSVGRGSSRCPQAPTEAGRSGPRRRRPEPSGARGTARRSAAPRG